MIAGLDDQHCDRQGTWMPCGRSRLPQLDLGSGRACWGRWSLRWVLKEGLELFRQRLGEALQAEGAVCVRTCVLAEYTQNSKEFGVLDGAWWGPWGGGGNGGWIAGRRQAWRALGYPGLDQGQSLDWFWKPWDLSFKEQGRHGIQKRKKLYDFLGFKIHCVCIFELAIMVLET